MSKQYTVKVLRADNSEQITVFQAGQPARLKALPKAQYQLVDAASGVAPDAINAKRVGNDLHVNMINGQEQNLVIEGYFDAAEGCALVGQAADGMLYSYSPEVAGMDMDAASAERAIAYVLGQGIVNTGAAFGTLAFQPVLAAASLGGAVAVASGSGNTAVSSIAVKGEAAIADVSNANASQDSNSSNDSVLGPISRGTAVSDVAIASEGSVVGRNASVASDTTAPSFATGSIRMQSDSGSSNTDGITNNKRPAIFGQTEALAKVEVTVGGKTYTTQANSFGLFEVQVDQDLSDGLQTISIKASDSSDNAATFSGTSFTVDTAAPAAPSDLVVNDNVGASKGNLSAGDRTDDTTPTLSGKAPAGAEFVRVYSNGTLVASVAVDQANQTWSFAPSTSLLPGDYAWQAASVDKAGNESGRADAVAFKVVSEAPRTAAITGVFDNQGAIQGVVGKGVSTDDRVLEVRGSGVAGDTVRLFSNGVQVGTNTVNADGQWTVTTSQLNLGGNDLIARLFNGSAQRGSDSGVYRVVVDTDAPAKPSFTVSEDLGSSQEQIDANATTDDATPTFAGTGATAGDTIIAREGNVIIGSAVVASNGNWTLTSARPLGNGDHTVSVTARDAAGNESEAETFAFKVAADNQTLNVLRAVDNVAGNTGDIGNNGLTNDTTPTLEGTGRPGLRVIVTEDGKSIGTTVVDPDGTWRFVVPASAGTEGTHTFTANTLSAVGGSQSSSFTITIDTTAPAAPTSFVVRDDVGGLQAALTSGAATDDATPTFEGTNATPGDIIKVYEGAIVVGSAQVGTNGNWSVTVNPLTQGQRTLTLTQTDAAGNESVRSEAFVLNVDTIAAATPTSVVINDNAGQVTGEIKDKDRTDDTTPTISGKAEAGTVFVNVYDGNAVVGTATVQQDGSWSFTPAVALTSKDYAWSVSAVDSARNESDRSPVTTFTVVTDAPSAPAITNVVDNQGTITGNVAKDSTTDDRQLEVRGTGTAGNKIELFADGKKVGETTVQNNGSWSITTSQLDEGPVDLTAKQVDTIGQTSPETGAYSVVVDITAPGTPAFDVKDNVGAFKGDIDSGDTTDDATPTFEGKGATPGDTITVREGNTVLGTATVDKDGNWSVTPTNALSEGAHKVSVIASDPAGNPSTAGDISFTVDTTDQPVSITRAVDDVDPSKGNVAPGGVTNDQSPTLQGTGKPGVTVTISKDGQTVDTVVVDAKGNWTFDIEDELDDGEHTYTANAVNAAGNPSSDSFTFTVDTQAPDAPTGFEVKDDVGAIQGELKDGDSTDDVTPTIEGKGATPGDVIKVYADGNVVGSELVKADGTWSVTTESLPQGEQELTVTQTDKAGNESKPSEPFTVVVDTRAPNAPTVDTVTNKLDADDKPTSTEVKGKAEPGSTVTVLDEDGKVVGTTTTDANGDFTVVVTPALENGETYDVIASDKAGNPSAPTEITADTSAPDSNTTQISVNDITADNIVNAAESGTTIAVTGRVTGQFRVGDVVSVVADGVTTTGTVTSNGNYSVNVSGNNLAKDSDTKIQVSVRATDSSNNAGTIRTEKTYSVDTSAPDSNSTQISVNNITADNIVNLAESGTTIAVTGKVTGQFRAGDVVSVTANGITTSGTVNSSGDYTVNVSGDNLAKDSDTKIRVSVRATDGANNAGNIAIDKTYSVDTSAPDSNSTQITVNDITPDNIVNAAESGTTIAVTGKVTGDFRAGDVVSVTANGVTTSGTVTSNGNYSVDVSGDNLAKDNDSKIRVSVRATDGANNAGNIAIDKTYSVDTSAPDSSTTQISVNDITADNIVNAVESGTTIAVTGKVTGQFRAGDVVSVTADGVTTTGTVDSKGDYRVDVSGDNLAKDNDRKIQVSVRATDGAANAGNIAIEKTYSVDTSAPDSNTTQISVNDITADNIVNAVESGTTIAVTGKVTGQFRAGDVVSVTANGITTSGTVNSSGDYTVNVSGDNLAKDSDTKIRVSVRATDGANNAGNIAIDKTYSVDTSAPDSNSTQISVNDITADNIVNAAESGTTIAVTGRVTGQFRAGDVVSVTANGVTTTGTVASNGNYTVDVSGDNLAKDNDSKIRVSVRATDGANNAGNIAIDKTYSVDTSAPNSSTTTIAVSSITADNILNAAEVNGTLTVAGTVSGEFKQGDVISVTAHGVTTSATVAADGKFSVDVSGANLRSDSDTTVQVSLTTTDTAGNTGTIVVDKAYTVDTTAPTLSVSLSDNNLVPGQTSVVTFSFSERVSGFDANDITAPNGSISNLATADNGRTWTATFTPTAGVNDNTNTISVGNGYTDIAGNGGSGATSANYAILTTVSASLGNATSVSRTVTSYQTVNTFSTAYRTILDDTRVSGDSAGHDWRIRYKLANGHQGEIDINDSKGWTDGSDRVIYQGSHIVGVTDLMVYQPGKKDGLWLSQKNGGFNYTNVSNIGLEDCHGIFGWGWFADWNDAYVSVRVETFQQHTGTTQQAVNTIVQDTQYNVNFGNAALYASETPNACYRVVLTGGNNYQLRDASGKVLMTGAGTYQATISQIEAGLKVYVLNGGSAPSISTSLVSTTSPIVLDLNGDGIHTTSLEEGVQFDLDASGTAQQVAWIDRNDGLLVLDLNGNGTIDNGSEMFGNHTQLANGSKAADGWQALEQYDSNGDRVISALDDIFSQLQVWVDANGDGVTGEGELFSLQDLGIKDIALDHDGSQTVQNGNLLSGIAHATTDDGQQLQVTDAWLETKPLDEPQLQVASYIVI